MATIFSHALVASAIKQVFPFGKENKRVLFYCVVLSILPDLDVIGFSFGIRYEDALGHRGFTHSLLFAVLVGGSLPYILFRHLTSTKKKLLGFLFFLSIISHAILDAFTNGGLGVGFFIPFDNTRYFFPWTPIEVSPIGRNFFSARGLVTLMSETRLILVPVIVFYLISFWRKRKTNNQDQ